MRLSHDNLMTHFLGKVPYTSWLFTTDLSKKSGNLVGNFHWVRTVPVVQHLLKVSGLSRHASRLDSSYKMNFQFGTSEPRKQRDYLFRISVCPGNFPVGRTKKRLPCIYIPRGISANFREFVVNGKQPLFTRMSRCGSLIESVCISAEDMK